MRLLNLGKSQGVDLYGNLKETGGFGSRRVKMPALDLLGPTGWTSGISRLLALSLKILPNMVLQGAMALCIKLAWELTSTHHPPNGPTLSILLRRILRLRKPPYKGFL